MIRTIVISGYITAQGIFQKALPCGRIQILDGSRLLTGFPVTAS